MVRLCYCTLYFGWGGGISWCNLTLLQAGWSLVGAAFAFFTFCNIGPRGVQHHAYYQSKFKEEYPKNRKGVIPFLW